MPFPGPKRSAVASQRELPMFTIFYVVWARVIDRDAENLVGRYMDGDHQRMILTIQHMVFIQTGTSGNKKKAV